jgi:hypothetical protein
MLVGSHPESDCDGAWLVHCGIGVTAAPVTRSSFCSLRTSASPQSARASLTPGRTLRAAPLWALGLRIELAPIAIVQRRARHGSCSRALRLSGAAARGRARLSAASASSRGFGSRSASLVAMATN